MDLVCKTWAKIEIVTGSDGPRFWVSGIWYGSSPIKLEPKIGLKKHLFNGSLIWVRTTNIFSGSLFFATTNGTHSTTGIMRLFAVLILEV